MKVQEIVDSIQRNLINPSTGKVPAPYDDAYHVLSQAKLVLLTIVQKEQWSWAVVHSDPIVKTEPGVRSYRLPEGFPSNFLRGSGDAGEDRQVRLSDGSGESRLVYRSPEQFYKTDFEAASNEKPSHYTITTGEDGRKWIVLDPPPDRNSGTQYTIRGSYSRNFRELGIHSHIPDEVSSYLIFRVLEMVNPQRWVGEARLANSALYLGEARNLQPQMSNAMSNPSGINEWEI